MCVLVYVEWNESDNGKCGCIVLVCDCCTILSRTLRTPVCQDARLHARVDSCESAYMFVFCLVLKTQSYFSSFWGGSGGSVFLCRFESVCRCSVVC